jgi:hypothetical protein
LIYNTLNNQSKKNNKKNQSNVVYIKNGCTFAYTKTQKTMNTTTTTTTETIELFSILNYAKSNGQIKFEVQETGKTYCNEKLIGISFGKFVWHWFTLVQYNNDGQQYLTFLESYSTNTGKTKSGMIHMMNVCRSLNKKLKTNLF